MASVEHGWDDKAETIVNFSSKSSTENNAVSSQTRNLSDDEPKTIIDMVIDPPTVMDLSDALITARQKSNDIVLVTNPPEIPSVLDTVHDATPVNTDLPVMREPEPPAPVDAQPHEKMGAFQFLSPSQPHAHPSEMMDIAWLVIVNSRSARVRQIFTLDAARMELGRVPSTSICIEDKAVSSRHAAIRYERVEERQEFVLYDLASTNGTYVNGVPVQRAILQDDDRIRVGETEIAFKRVGVAGA